MEKNISQKTSSVGYLKGAPISAGIQCGIPDQRHTGDCGSLHPKGFAVQQSTGVPRIDYVSFSQEDLYWGLANGELTEDAFSELFRRLRPCAMHMAYNYMKPMGMDEDDMAQEAMILLWIIIMRHTRKPEELKFSSYYYRSWENRLNTLWIQFIIKNPVPYPYEWNWCFKEPLGDSVVYWSDKGKEYLEKEKLRRKRWSEKTRVLSKGM